jgi:hypothetical protein
MLQVRMAGWSTKGSDQTITASVNAKFANPNAHSPPTTDLPVPGISAKGHRLRVNTVAACRQRSASAFGTTSGSES